MAEFDGGFSVLSAAAALGGSTDLLRLSAFFCRRCHDLTYESVQRSGSKTEKFFQGVARTLHTSTREARRWVRLNYAKQSYVPEVKRPVLDKTRERRTGIPLLVTKKALSKGLTL